MIRRILENRLRSDFGKGKILLVTGARQVGKTTLFDLLLHDTPNVLRFNCDDAQDRDALADQSPSRLRNIAEGYDFIIIDEAQKIPDAGLTLKILADLKTDAQILVTGSSSLELSEQASESAAGRVWNYGMYPLSLAEMYAHTSRFEESKFLGQRLIYGMYPEVVTRPSDAVQVLRNLSSDYLYRDILAYRGMRKPSVLQKLVRALALQIGGEVSYNELASLIGANKETVSSYINLLEKCFVVFTLSSYSRNERNEIKRGKKVYFHDNGIRNAVLGDFTPIDRRSDVGALWENFLVSERLKRDAYSGGYARLFFWRTTTQQEVDLVEEKDGELSAFEFKWNPKRKPHVPSAFAAAYPGAQYKRVDRENYFDFVL